MKIEVMMVFAGMIACHVAHAVATPEGERTAIDPQVVFENPPQSAKTGVWWHWMGCNVSKEGIVKDLDWFKETGIGAATIFGMADACTPWAASIRNSPTAGLVAFTPDWWALVRFACGEAERRGIELGIHNCPGYTSTGGPWIPPRLAMRELVFDVTNAEEQISLKAHALFPVEIGGSGTFDRPDVPSRRTDIQEIGIVDGIRVQHIPMGSFTQPNQWEAFGLECDKMNPEAVAFHLDHVIGEMKRYLGDQVGRGLKFVLLDSYEAGKPSWTPQMREEFQKRRGYDPLPYLPVLGGYKVSAAPDEASAKKFKADYARTIADLYRDVLFKIMHEKLKAAGLEFACEPYGGPFNTQECAAYVDRPMTEFWFRPNLDRKVPGVLGWNQWTGPNGQRHNVVEAEAFTSGPPSCNWTETPYQLKAVGDSQFYRGVNRMTLHTCPHQPWDDTILPGKVMGRWGTHFGRTQTWAKSGKGWFDYLNRCQALLQWGEPSQSRIVGNDITPRGTFLTAQCRESDGTYVFFVMNHSDRPASMKMELPDVGKAPEWFDPVTGRITPLAVVKGRVPIQLAPCGSGFLVLRKPAGSLAPTRESDYLQRLPKPYAGSASVAVAGPWQIRFGDVEITSKDLFDWTTSANPQVKYFSGTAKYRTTFTCAADATADFVSLGDCNGQVAKVVLNGTDVGTVWCAPYEVLLPPGAVRRGENVLEIEFTNVWANRLIGDEQEPPDCEFVEQKAFKNAGGTYLARFPDWFKDGIAARPSKGRRCFTDWNYFTKDSKLVPSGLLGPVRFYALNGSSALPDETCDVAVIGGGAAGVAAAVQSGRAGARTILIEQGHQVGGNMTSGGVNFPGLFHAWGRQVIDGVGWEIVTNCVALDGGALPDFSKPTGRQHWRHQVTINIPLYVALAEEALTQAGVTIHYHAAPMRIVRDGDLWKISVTAVGDTRTVTCRQIVDCTGNGAVAALLGLERMRESVRQPGSFVYKISPGAPLDALDAKALEAARVKAVMEGRLLPNDTRAGVMGFLRRGGDTANYIDDADNSTADLRTQTNLRGRASMLRMYRFLKSLPGLGNVRLLEMSPEVGVRETYRVRGEYVITHDDYTSGRTFADSVCYAFYPIDLHDKVSGIRPAHLKEGMVATVPLRALVVKGVDGILVAGRCVSSDRLANSALRVEATCMATGQAAGAAAALAARHGTTALKLDFGELAALLRAHRAIVPSP